MRVAEIRRLCLSTVEERGPHERDQQGAGVQEDVGSARLVARPGHGPGLCGEHLLNEGRKIPAQDHLFEHVADGDVLAIDAREVDEDLSAVSPAEDEPGIALVGQPAVRLQLEAGLDERARDPVELGDLARRPPGLQTVDEGDTLGRHGASTLPPKPPAG